MEITIIGGGASGLLTAVNILKTNTRSVIINIIEPGSLGLGAAYNVENMRHLLNVPAFKMSCISDDPDHFINWLKEKGYTYKNTDFVARKIYGEYIRSTYDKYLDENKSATVNHIKDHAIDIVNENGVLFVATKGGKKIKSDKIVLALGNFSSTHPKTKSNDYISDPKYIANPLDANSIKKITDKTRNVFIIGTGLTAVDTIISIREANPKVSIIAFSNHGYLPVQHNLNQSYPSYYEELKGIKTTLELFNVVHKHIKLAAAKHIDYKAVTDAIRPYTQEIWSNLPEKEKLQFLRHLRHYWGVARHRMPSESANYIYELINFGKVQLLKGRIKDIRIEGKHLVVATETRKGEIENHQADYVINCTGPQSDYGKIDNTLIKNLVNKGLIVPDDIKYGINADKNGAVIGKDNIPSNKLFTVGPPMKGILWECVAIPEIKMQTNKLAIELTR